MFSKGKTKSKGRGVHTTASGGRVWCRICGRPVHSRLGEVCSRTSCHDRYLARHDADGG